MPTFSKELSPTNWTDLGTGPMFLQNREGGSAIYYIISTSPPVVLAGADIADVPQFRLGGEGEVRDISINFTQNVYARGRGVVFYAR